MPPRRRPARGNRTSSPPPDPTPTKRHRQATDLVVPNARAVDGGSDADLSSLDADPLVFLLAPTPPADFWYSDWQARPALFPATPSRREWVTTLPTTASLVAHAAGLRWGLDVVAARFQAGARTDLNAGPWGSLVDGRDLARLSQAATLQVHHPQRWDDPAWRVVAALEAFLGCLVGANAYLTPAGGAQGLAPHWDDVDVFVIQVEGRKFWQLHEPLPEHALACGGPSGDLTPGGRLASEKRLSLEVILSPGDVLYIPRGTVHQARTLTAAEEKGKGAGKGAGKGGGPSNHLTISFAQGWSGADLACAAVRAAACGAASAGGSALAPLRRSLDPGAVFTAGFGAAAAATRRGDAAPAAALASTLRALADAVEKAHPPHEPSLFDLAWDGLASDFFASRLPPYPSQLSGPPSGASSAPTVGASIACVAPRCFRLVGGADPESEEAYVALISCLGNDRERHMVGGRDGGGEGDGQGGSSDEEEEGESGSSSDEEGTPSSCSSSSSSDDDDAPTPSGPAALFPASDAPALAAALAATARAPVVVVGNEDQKGAAHAPTSSIPLRLAMTLWGVGAAFVVV